jgi:hypothetical protein
MKQPGPLPNKRIKLTVSRVTPLARWRKRRATRPAAYPRRYADPTKMFPVE